VRSRPVGVPACAAAADRREGATGAEGPQQRAGEQRVGPLTPIDTTPPFEDGGSGSFGQTYSHVQSLSKGLSVSASELFDGIDAR
jgi:hypothetical protein